MYPSKATWCTGAACVALSLCGATVAKELQALSSGTKVDVQRAARAVMVNGQVQMVGDWIERTSGPSACGTDEALSFDAFTPDGNYPGFPTGGGPSGCNVSSNETSRWFFGQTYCNTFAVNDMSALAGGSGSAVRVEFAWYWFVGGTSSAEPMLIAIFHADDFNQGCADPVIDNVFTGVLVQFVPDFDGGGVNCAGLPPPPDTILDSTLGGPAGYFFTDICLEDFGLSIDAPGDGDGGYIIQILTCPHNGDGSCVDCNGDGAPDFRFASCGQPMLWGNDVPNYSTEGSQTDIQYDDDNPRDGTHDAVNECYSYAFGLCPDPLGAMYCFYSRGGGGACASDGCNGNEGLKARSRSKNCGCLVKGVLTNGSPGSVYGIVLPSGECVQKAANDRGKVVAKECPSSSGTVSVPTCGLQKSVVCP